MLHIFKSFEKIGSWPILVLILAAYYLDYVPNSNEENYLQLAKQFMQPEWIQDSFILQESSGTRFLYQYIVGFFLQYFPFEFVVVLFRSLFIIGFSFILSKIYKLLKISNVMLCFHLVLLYLDKQSYFAGSWIFLSVEAKTFAYLSLLTALYFTIQKKYNLSILFLIITTYFHILIGGYAFMYIALSILILEKFKFKTDYKLLLKLGTYGIAVAPLVITLLQNTNFSQNLTPSADWIYTYYRNPHHTTLSNSLGHLRGVIHSLLATLALIYFLKKCTDSKMRVVIVIALITLSATLLLVPLIFIDDNGTLLKFYLFRLNAFSIFLFTLVVTNWLFKLFHDRVKKPYSLIGYLILAVFIVKNITTTMIDKFENQTKYATNGIREITDYIKNNTPKNAVILGLFEKDKYSLTRRMERDRFVVYKFVPADLNKIHNWYYRTLEKELLAEDIEHLKVVGEKYKIDFLLTEQKYDKPYLKFKYNSNGYFLYQNTIMQKTVPE